MLSQPNPDEVSEFIHCFHWRSKRELFDHEYVFPYHAFFDEYEVDKELGSHSAKLGAVYAKLACLPPKYQGTVENVFLALLFNHEDRKEYSFKNVVRIFIAELKFLQDEGKEIHVKGKKINVYFVLGLALGDNLGLMTWLNLVECFSANYCCRFCYASKDMLHRMIFEDPGLMRNEVQHKKDVVAKAVKESGVVEPSALADIEHFLVTENPFVDLMHDLDEGIAVYDMQHLLHYLIFVKNYFTVNQLNFALTTFNYCSDMTNRPPQLNGKRVKNKSINMTAAEMRSLVRILPMLIGDLVDESDEMWKLYLFLRDLYDIVLSPSVQRGVSTILKNTIAEHHRLYIKLTGDTLKPKHHFVIHYPQILLKSGPFVKYSYYRPEAKHQVGVQDAKATKSRRFIAHTIAIKEQLRFAYRLQSRKGLCAKLEVGCEKSTGQFDKKDLPSSFQNSVCFPVADVNGTIYKADVCVVTGGTDDDGPEFGIISDVFVNDNREVGLLYHMLSTVSYSTHFHAYEVRKVSKKNFLPVTDLLDYHPVLFH